MNYHKELLTEIIEEWDIVRLDGYIYHLKEKEEHLEEWIRQVQAIRRKKVKSKSTPENGARDGR